MSRIELIISLWRRGMDTREINIYVSKEWNVPFPESRVHAIITHEWETRLGLPRSSKMRLV